MIGQAERRPIKSDVRIDENCTSCIASYLYRFIDRIRPNSTTAFRRGAEKESRVESKEYASRSVATARMLLRKTSGLFYGAVKYDLGFN